jgi:hypothetical protein
MSQEELSNLIAVSDLTQKCIKPINDTIAISSTQVKGHITLKNSLIVKGELNIENTKIPIHSYHLDQIYHFQLLMQSCLDFLSARDWSRLARTVTKALYFLSANDYPKCKAQSYENIDVSFEISGQLLIARIERDSLGVLATLKNEYQSLIQTINKGRHS